MPKGPFVFDSHAFMKFFALASAVEYKAAIVTGDPDFRKVKRVAEILWI